MMNINTVALKYILAFMTVGRMVNAAELHVAVNGSDSSPETRKAPLRTIQRGADLAQPGDVVTVHAGIYGNGSIRANIMDWAGSRGKVPLADMTNIQFRITYAPEK